MGRLSQADGTSGPKLDNEVTFTEHIFEAIAPLLKDVSFPVGNISSRFSDENLCLSVS